MRQPKNRGSQQQDAPFRHRKSCEGRKSNPEHTRKKGRCSFHNRVPLTLQHHLDCTNAPRSTRLRVQVVVMCGSGGEERPTTTGGAIRCGMVPTRASLKTRGVLTAFSESKLREKWHFMAFWSLKTTGMATPATLAGGGGAAAAPAAQHNRAAPCNLEGGALDLRRVREEGNHHSHTLSQSGLKGIHENDTGGSFDLATFPYTVQGGRSSSTFLRRTGAGNVWYWIPRWEGY